MRFQDKVVLVVGSTAGIGKAMAKKFASEGATAIITGRRESKGLEVVKEIEREGGKAAFYTMDVTDLEKSGATLDRIVEEQGKLDVFCYNSGIAPVHTVYDVTPEMWDSVNNTNTKAAFFLAQRAIPALKATKGAIVFTSSLVALSAVQSNGGVAYASSKIAINHITRLLALALAPDGVRVNAVAPGMTMTDILTGVPDSVLENLKNSTPLRMIGQPEDIANAAAFLASEEARYITGQILPIDGGASIC